MIKDSKYQQEGTVLYVYVPNHRPLKKNEAKIDRTKKRKRQIHRWSWRFQLIELAHKRNSVNI